MHRSSRLATFALVAIVLGGCFKAMQREVTAPARERGGRTVLDDRSPFLKAHMHHKQRPLFILILPKVSFVLQ